MNLANDNLFVYGTLMSVFNNSKSHRLKSGNRILDKGYINGYLYEINGYPGAIHDPTTGNKVFGELFHLSSAENTFLWMDRYEEAGLEFHQDPEYTRILVPVYTQSKKYQAWMYQYIRPIKGLQRIYSGNYLDHIKK